MRRTHSHDRFGVDSNGCLTELAEIDGQSVMFHYSDVPESDITTVRGIRVTTPLRTVIDLASSLDPAQLQDIVDNFMGRGLFTREDARRRLAEPDLWSHRGARVLRAFLRL